MVALKKIAKVYFFPTCANIMFPLTIKNITENLGDKYNNVYKKG